MKCVLVLLSSLLLSAPLFAADASKNPNAPSVATTPQEKKAVEKKEEKMEEERKEEKMEHRHRHHRHHRRHEKK